MKRAMGAVTQVEKATAATRNAKPLPACANGRKTELSEPMLAVPIR
jgi:hypothetical protein